MNWSEAHRHGQQTVAEDHHEGKSPEQPVAEAEEVVREDDREDERVTEREEDWKDDREDDREDDIAEAEEGHPSLGPHDYRNDDVSDTDTAYMITKQHLASTTPHLR